MIPTSCRPDLAFPCPPFAPICGHRDPVTMDGVPHHATRPNIGVVIFQIPRRGRAEAILDAQGVWRCPELPVLDRVLNALHGPGRHPRGDQPYGQVELVRVAAWLKGKVVLGKP